MKPTTTIFIGAPVSGDEARFLCTLHADLADTGALILANFFAKQRQIDFVVITATYAAILELKNFPCPVFGDRNGIWTYSNFAGNQVRYPGANPWQQTLEQKYALSDEMKRYQEKNRDVASPSGRGFFSDFGGFVCVYPKIHPESQVTTGDHKVEVRSYAEVSEILRSGSKPSTWSPTEWRRFAEKHLKLTPVTVEEATDRRINEASEKIRAYTTRINALIGSQLPPLLPDSDDPDCGRRLIDSALEPKNFLLVGPSGSAKTFHLHHLCLAISASEEEVPLLVEAKKDRGGEFWRVLRQGTGPLFRGDPKELLEAIRLCGLRPVLMIDALNDCSESDLPDLIRSAQTFALQFDARLIFTSQTNIELPADLQATTKRLSLPNTLQKRPIYCHHAGLGATSDVDVFCTGFTNAYDLTIAGRCHASGKSPESRIELYDRYVRRYLPEHTAVAAAILRKVAGQMGNTVTVAWTRDSFERTAEYCIAEQHVSLAILDELRHCRLIDLKDEFFSFEHELLLHYFKAEDLRRRVNDVEELAAELTKPRNQNLLELLVPRFTHPADIATILSTVDDTFLLCRVLAGKCGMPARSVLLEQCQQLLDAAAQDLPNVGITCETIQAEDGRRRFANLDIQGNHQWTAYDALLCHVIALNLDNPRLQEKFLELLDLTEWRLRAAVHSAARNAGFKAGHIWGEAVRFYGGIFQEATLHLPCAAILSSLRTALLSQDHYAQGLPIREQLLERTRRTPESHFSLLALLQDWRCALDAGRIVSNLGLIRQGWNSGIYILRLDAVELLQWMRRPVEEIFPEELAQIREMLESFETDNIVENTVRLETLASYDGLDLVVSADDALSEMKAAITPNAVSDPALIQLAALSDVPPAQFLAEHAYGCLSKIFEDIFQGVYSQAYFELSEDEKRDILCLAAKARDPGFYSDWILRELLQWGGKHALHIYQHYASGVNAESFSAQEAVATFVLGIEGCAQWSDAPPPYQKGESPEHQAWQAIGEILFWLSRGSEAADSRQRIEELWARCEGPVLLAAGDVLYQLSHSRWFLGDHRTGINLITMFAKEVRPIVEYCIIHRESLPSLFQHGGSTDRNVIRFLLGALGSIGDDSAIPTLQEIVDDREFGKDAIQAIESIRKTIVAHKALRAPQ